MLTSFRKAQRRAKQLEQEATEARSNERKMKREARQLQEVAEAAQLAVSQSEFLGEMGGASEQHMETLTLFDSNNVGVVFIDNLNII